MGTLTSNVMGNIAGRDALWESARLWKEQVWKILVDYGAANQLVNVNVGP